MKKAKRPFLHDAIDFANLASQSLENDYFSDCFNAVSSYEMKGSSVLYVFSFIIRYFILFPLKIIVFAVDLAFISIYFLYGKIFLQVSSDFQFFYTN